jgi:topoisomerase-4 subunit B
VRLTLTAGDDSHRILDLLLAKSRSADRRAWLEKNGNLADI